MKDFSPQTLGQIAKEYAPAAKVERIEAIAPDMSTRTYFRIFLSEAPQERVVAMCIDSLSSPEFEGGPAVPADEAYVSLTRFFLRHGIPVPELYYDKREAGVLLIEDVGDRLLAPALLQNPEDRQVQDAYRRAVDLILALQAIPLNGSSVAEQRRFSAAALYHEAKELHDYLLPGTAVTEEQAAEYLEAAEQLAEHIPSLPQALTHRDYHGWNLLIDPKGALRIIDFQDALMAPRAYDLVGLINDRDMDSALGRRLYCELLQKFAASTADRAAFLVEFSIVALQRDLKVAGRFAKLRHRGVERYAVWIPGTLQRIGRTLQHLEPAAVPGVERIAHVLRPLFAEVEQGYEAGSWY